MSGSCTTLFPTLNPIANSRGMSKKRREELPEGGERTSRKADGRCHPTKALKSKPWMPLLYRLVQARKGPCQWNNFWTFWVLDFLWQLRSQWISWARLCRRPVQRSLTCQRSPSHSDSDDWQSVWQSLGGWYQFGFQNLYELCNIA